MAQNQKAFKFLGYTNRRGVPVFAVILINAVGAISMMNVSTGASRAYQYIINPVWCVDFPGLDLHHIYAFSIPTGHAGTGPQSR